MTTFCATLRDLLLNIFAIIANCICLPFSIWSCLNALFCNKKKLLIPKVVAITGANSGIGEGLAYTYAKDKCSLVLLARNLERLEKVAEACKKLGAENVQVVKMDVSDTKGVAEFLEKKVIDCDIDLFIANAGVATIPNTPLLDQAEQIFQINTMGAIAGMNAVYKAYVKRGRGGQIVCVSSVFGLMNPPLVLSYGASKAAVMSYTRDLRALGKDDGITVNTIAPGFIKTAMTSSFSTKQSFFHLTPEYFAERVKHGLANDVPIISLPLHQYFAFGVLSILPPTVKQVVADLLHTYVDKLLSKRKKVA